MFKLPESAPKHYSDKSKQQTSTFFGKRKRSPEEKALLIIIRDEFREEARNILAEDGEQPTDQEVEKYLDCFIEDVYESGKMKEMLDRCLEQKIAAQMK